MYWLWERVCSVLLSKIATATSLAREGATIQGTDWAQVQSNPPFSISFFTSLHLSGDRGFEPRRQHSCFGICHIYYSQPTSDFDNCSISNLFLVNFCHLNNLTSQLDFCSIDTYNIADQTNWDEAHQASIGHRIDSCRNHGNPLQSCK